MPASADNDIPVLRFASALAWEQWLGHNCRDPRGVWIQFAKKASGIASVTYDEALDIALCFGWIDGQRKTHDADYFLQRFTPRRAKSLWSKRNVAKVAQLTDAGRMQLSGLAEVEAARGDGRWDAAYDTPTDMTVPEDFLTAVQRSANAAASFATLNKTNRYAIAWRLHAATKPEIRARRFAALLKMLENGEKLH